MRKIIIFLILLCLLVSGVSAASITDCTVENTNIYADSNLLQIGPSGQIDSTSTATGITNVAGRYIYASGLTADVTGATVAYTQEGRQGSTIISATQGTAQSWAWTFGDGETSTTAQETSHTYAEPGTYQTSLKLTNYLDATGVTVNTGNFNILPIAPTASASAPVVQLGDTVTFDAVGILWSGIQWQYSTDGTTWQDITGGTTKTYEWTPEAGEYTIRAKVTSTVTGYTAYSNTLSVGVYAPPVISAASLSPEIATQTPQSVTLTATVTDSGPAATTYQWQQSPIGTTTWADITGATTAEWTGSISITQATQIRLQATGSGGTTTSQTLWIYPQSTAQASPQTGTPQSEITLSASSTYGADIQWQYSTDGTTWADITGATTTTYEWTPATPNQYSVRAELTYPAKTIYSTTATFTIYAPPVITAVSISPEIGSYTQTITLAATVTDSGPTATTYQWQQSPENQNTWTDIAGATTATWIGELTFTGATDFRLLATGTGGTTTSQTVTYYIALPGEIQTLSASPNVVSLPGSTTLTATGSNVRQWEWQEYISGSWVSIGYGTSLTESLNTEGTYTYRVLATGADGVVITSESLEVLAGFAPTVEITSPADGTHYDSGERILVTATVTGTDAEWQWNFGSDNVQTGGNGLESWVEYSIDGSYTISIRAESIFGTAQDSLTIISGRLSRPIATTPTTELEADGIYEVTDALTPEQNGMPDLWGFIQTLSKPFTDIIGAWFYLVLFAVPYFIIWIRQKNIIIPSILGVMFGAWVLVMLPATALPAAIGILALAITGGLYGLYVKINR